MKKKTAEINCFWTKQNFSLNFILYIFWRTFVSYLILCHCGNTRACLLFLRHVLKDLNVKATIPADDPQPTQGEDPLLASFSHTSKALECTKNIVFPYLKPTTDPYQAGKTQILPPPGYARPVHLLPALSSTQGFTFCTPNTITLPPPVLPVALFPLFFSPFIWKADIICWFNPLKNWLKLEHGS